MWNEIPGLKALLILQFLVGLAASAAGLVLGDLQLGASIAVGSALMWANIAALAWTWWRVLTKKSIAWTVLIIVIKYAVLLGSILIFVRTPWLNVLGVGLGVSSFAVAALVTAFITQKKEKQEIGSSTL